MNISLEGRTAIVVGPLEAEDSQLAARVLRVENPLQALEERVARPDEGEPHSVTVHQDPHRRRDQLGRRRGGRHRRRTPD